MRCPSCNFDNPDASSFCIECGVALERRCPKCGFDNLPQAKFCGRCGSSLTEPAGSASGANTDVGDADWRQLSSRDGERRHLTVLFCDLVGSTEIVSRLDPEEWREVIAAYHQAATQAIERFGGYVAQYLGDGVMAYFGYPEAHDNDAERAARAGLAILDAVTKLGHQPSNARLSARVGIHSGPVVVGAGAGKVTDVFGDVPNIAARVQVAAEPDTVVVTDATYRLVSGLFIVEERGAQQLKGIAAPIELFTVVGPSGARGRLAAARKLTRFVGREDDLDLLMSRWGSVREGKGQVLVLVGEPGIGKSRLVREFHERIAGEACIWIESASDQLAQSRPYYAVTGMLRRGLGWRGDEGVEWQIGSLATSLQSVGLKASEALPLVAPLLNLPIPKNYPPVPAAPEEQRRRLLAALSRWVTGTAEIQP